MKNTLLLALSSDNFTTSVSAGKGCLVRTRGHEGAAGPWLQHNWWQPTGSAVSAVVKEGRLAGGRPVGQSLTLCGQEAVAGRHHALPLCELQDRLIAEVVLLGGLDAEGPLGPHAGYCLEHIKGAELLQLGQADVQ